MLQTSHNPYFAFTMPDLQGAMPGILAEMTVYSAPGVVEPLPAMPDSLSKGSVSGMWLYTFAKLEEMKWDLSNKIIEGRIVSFRDQEIILRYRHKPASFLIDGNPEAGGGNYIKLKMKKDIPVSFKIQLK